MNNNPYLLDSCLDDFVNGDISKEELSNSISVSGLELQQEISLHQTAIKLVEQYSIIQTLQSVRKELNMPNTSYVANNREMKLADLTDTPTTIEPPTAKIRKMNIVKSLFKIAAVLTISFASYIAYQYYSNNADSLYSELYQDYTITTTRAPQKENNNIVTLYQENKYNEVIESFLQKQSTTNREKFLAAQCYMKSNKFEEAATLLKQIVDNNKTLPVKLYNDDAEFYLGLCYLKSNDYKNALPIFTKINNDLKHIYNEKVNKSMLRKLKWL